MKRTTEDRQSRLNTLAGVERAIVLFYRLLLGLIIVAILGVVVLTVLWRPWGAGHQGEWFYFAIAVLLALGWCVGQFIALGRGRRKGDSLPIQVQSGGKGSFRTWRFQLGSTPPPDCGTSAIPEDAQQMSFSRSFEIPLASISTDMLPDEEAIRCLKAELDKGNDLHEACQVVLPAYVGWNSLEQQAYRLYVTALLDQRSHCGDEESRVSFDV